MQKAKGLKKKAFSIMLWLLANNITNEKIYCAGYRYFAVMCFSF